MTMRRFSYYAADATAAFDAGHAEKRHQTEQHKGRDEVGRAQAHIMQYGKQEADSRGEHQQRTDAELDAARCRRFLVPWRFRNDLSQNDTRIHGYTGVVCEGGCLG